MTKALLHKGFHINDVKLHNLPQFEELGDDTIGDTEPCHDELHDEVERLITAARRSSVKNFTMSFAPSRDDYGRLLLEAAFNIRVNLSILQYRSAFLVVQNLSGCYRDDEKDKRSFVHALNAIKTHRRILVARFAPSNSPYIQRDDDFDWINDEMSLKAYDAVVDYVTASLAFFIGTSAEGEAWFINCLAVLARQALALKKLKTNLEYATRQVWLFQDLCDEMKDYNSEMKKPFEFEGVEGDILDDSRYSKEYFLDQFGFRLDLSAILHQVLRALQWGINDGPTGLLQERFDVCTLTPEGYAGAALIISSTGDKDITSSTGRISLAFATTMSQHFVRWACVEQLPNESIAPRTDVDVLRWKWREDDSESRGSLSIRTFEQAVTATVHIALSSAGVAQVMEMLANNISTQAIDEGPVVVHRYDRKQVSAFALSSGLGTAASKSYEDPRHEEILSLSTFAFRSSALGSDENAGPGAGARMNYERQSSKISSWQLQSDTVVVPCKAVTVRIIVPTLCIAILGVLLLVAPYQKPHGVDPSNLMIFLWSLSLSFLLVVKAYFVTDWPWHDFIRARVVCKSVSDLRRITGVDEQSIIMYLLRRQDPLKIRAGYAQVLFRPRLSVEESEEETSAGEGFLIDSPVKIDTLYATGFIVLKISTTDGPRLICINARTQGLAVPEKNWSLSPHIVGDLPFSEAGDGHTAFRVELRVEQVHWHRIDGLYVNKTCTFI